MNFQDLKSKFKNIVDICVDFIINNKRYFLAGVIFILMIVVVFAGTQPKTSGKNTSGVYKSFKQNSDNELETLINNYYTAYAEGDTDTLQTLASPYCDREISYIQFYSNYIDSYNDVKIYTKPGLTDDSYLVTTTFNLKFTGIDTLAPGLDFFYIEKNDEGKLYVNNIYKSFNEENNVYEMDTEVSDLIARFTQQQDLIDMRVEVQEEYDAAVESDSALQMLMDESLPAATIEWNTEYDAQVAAAAEEEAKAQEEAAAAAEAEAQAAAEAEEEANSYTGTTNATVNVRESADAESSKLGSLEAGTSVTIYAEEGDFYKIDYNGTRAYVTKSGIDVDSEDSTEETAEDTEEEEETTTTVSSIAEGTEITLSSTVNIRSQMDTSASKVAVAYAGEKVTVVMSYAEGWTKVKYGKKEGYVRTDLLQE